MMEYRGTIIKTKRIGMIACLLVLMGSYGEVIFGQTFFGNATPQTNDTGTLLYWNFNSFDPTTDAQINTDFDGSTGTSVIIDLGNWGGDLDDFSGDTDNNLNSDPAGSSLSLENQTGNGTYIEIQFSTLNIKDLNISYWTRRTGTGFDNNQWSYSNNGGITFANLGSVINPSSTTSGEVITIDASSVIDVEDQSNLILRYTLDGATSPSGNNRIDNLQITGTLINSNFASVQLTGKEGWRLLSTPVASTSYSTLLAPLWTQGTTGADLASGDAHIFTWPTGENHDESDPFEGWSGVSDLSTDVDATPGEGFLMYVFNDNEFGVTQPFETDKILNVTGNESATINYSSNTGDPDGWILFGNPFKSSISLPDFFGASGGNPSGLAEVAYVWDVNFTGGTEENDLPSAEFGTWRSYSTSASTIGNDEIMPFQAFFVQKSAQTSQVTFNDNIKAVNDGTFYGKEKNDKNIVSLFLNGESLFSTATIHLSERGSFVKTEGDAFELIPLSHEYAIFGAKKDDELFAIGHFPSTIKNFEIPLHVETTRSGTYQVSVNDINLNPDTELYFVDRLEDVEMKLDEEFSYSFDILNASKAVNPNPLSLKNKGPAKASVSDSKRFAIISKNTSGNSELPNQLTLNQNYPNPFNPTTVISYDLPVNSQVNLAVYDMMGRRVATLVNENVTAGTHQVQFDASSLSSGTYMYRLQAGGNIQTKKLTLIK